MGFGTPAPPNYHKWSGDVWKVAVELNHSKNVDFKICNIDRVEF